MNTYLTRRLCSRSDEDSELIYGKVPRPCHGAYRLAGHQNDNSSRRVEAVVVDGRVQCKPSGSCSGLSSLET